MDTVEGHGYFLAERPQLAVYDSKTVDVIWPQVHNLLVMGCDHLLPYMYPDDVLAAVRQDRMQLWVASDATGPFLAMVTQFLQYPRMRTLRLVWIGGERVASCMHYLDQIELFAKRSGCDRIEVTGRTGWLRVLKDYEFHAVSLYKELNSITEH